MTEYGNTDLQLWELLDVQGCKTSAQTKHNVCHVTLKAASFSSLRLLWTQVRAECR